MNSLKKGLTTKELQEYANKHLSNYKQCNYNENLQDVSFQIEKGYYSLGCTISSLIKVCQSAVGLQEFEKPEHEPTELVDVLEIARQLIPFEGLEFLDSITDNK